MDPQAPIQLSAHSLKGLESTDKMPPQLRQLVHEFGSEIVNEFIQHGVTDPNRIRRLVASAWTGARSDRQRGHQMAGSISPVVQKLDWLLVQARAEITAMELLRVLYVNNMIVVPLSPTDQAVAASMATVSGGTERMTKAEKHRRRLRAALDASVAQLWPHLNAKGT